MLERQLRVLDLARRVACAAIRPAAPPSGCPTRRAADRRCGTTTTLRSVGSPSAISAHALEHVELAPAVAVAVGDEQDLRLDLAEAVEHAAGAEIRRAGRPDDALRRARRARASPVSGMFGMKAATRSPGRRPSCASACAARDTSLVRLRVADAPLEAALVPEHEGVALVAAPQQVLGEIEARLGKPLRARHLVAVDQHRAALLRGDHAAQVPDLATRTPRGYRPSTGRTPDRCSARACTCARRGARTA